MLQLIDDNFLVVMCKKTCPPTFDITPYTTSATGSNCYECGKPGHIGKNCRAPKAIREAYKASLPPPLNAQTKKGGKRNRDEEES